MTLTQAIIAVRIALRSKIGQRLRRWSARRSQRELLKRIRRDMRLVLILALPLLGGCRIMPSWALRAHVDGYNALHPNEQIETTTEQQE